MIRARSKCRLLHQTAADRRQRCCWVLAAAFVFPLCITVASLSGCAWAGDSPQNAAVQESVPAASMVSLDSPSTMPADVPKDASVHQYVAAKGGEATVNGTSTLHNWTVKTGDIEGAVSGQWGSQAAPSLSSIQLTIPVKSLKSTEGSGMDNTMYDALKAKKNPSITYTLANSTLKSKPAKPNEPYRFETTGKLTVAGSTRNISLPLELSPQGQSLSISTNVKLKMTDFGVKPPKAMFGMIKSGDEVTVNVTWKLAPKAS